MNDAHMVPFNSQNVPEGPLLLSLLFLRTLMSPLRAEELQCLLQNPPSNPKGTCQGTT